MIPVKFKFYLRTNPQSGKSNRNRSNSNCHLQFPSYLPNPFAWFNKPAHLLVLTLFPGACGALFIESQINLAIKTVVLLDKIDCYEHHRALGVDNLSANSN